MSQLNSIESETIVNESSERIVFVTGFGPFRNYIVNASWEAVKRISINNAKLIIKEVPVIYDEVDSIVEHIWTQYKPWLVVHCGVSWCAKCLVIESRAFGSKYQNPDICGRIPKFHNTDTANDACECINNEINLSNVCDKINRGFNQKLIKMPAMVSHDAGRYLCEYIYHSSLSRNCQRTVFIHVPEIDNPYSVQEIGDALQYAINTLIDEINNFENTKK